MTRATTRSPYNPPAHRFEAGDVVGFLRNASLYTFQQGPVIETGHTIDGPGGHWRALLIDEALMEPPRPTVRWCSDAGPKPPPELLPKPSSRVADPSSQPTPHRRSLASKFKFDVRPVNRLHANNFTI